MSSIKDNLMELSKEELVEKILALERELAKYKNSNTPPSSNKHLKPNTFGKQTRIPKEGHPKAILEKQEDKFHKGKRLLTLTSAQTAMGIILLTIKSSNK